MHSAKRKILEFKKKKKKKRSPNSRPKQRIKHRVRQKDEEEEEEEEEEGCRTYIAVQTVTRVFPILIES
jgi:hypothetical protein